MARLFNPQTFESQKRSVVKNADWERINNLPWRDGTMPEDIDQLAEAMTSMLKMPGGQESLWPTQAWALAEAHDHEALFGAIPVGHGKFLILQLIPVLCNYKRPLLIVPAALREQTMDERRAKSKHWRLHPRLKILTYEQISTVNHTRAMQEYHPDCVLFDEVHKLKTLDSGRTSKVIDFFEEFPDVPTFAVSGSIENRSIKEVAHIALMTHKDQSPFPIIRNTVNQWSEALDAKVTGGRRRPGALLEWATEEDRKHAKTDTALGRRAFGRRMRATPGVVVATTGYIPVGLEILEHKYKIPDELADAINNLRKTWCTPGGEEFSEPFDLWRHTCELANGFYYRLNPPPPAEWAQARKEFHSEIRQIIKNNKRKLYTPLMVINAIDAGHYPEARPIVDAWRNIRDIYDPEEHREAVWVTHDVIKDAAKWAKKHRGVVWMSQKGVGEEFERVTGLPYFGASDERIRTHTGPCAASIQAHGTGKNLQQYSNGLIMTMPSSGEVCEQLIGRFHRNGQKEDTVHFFAYMHVRELWNFWKAALNDTEFVHDHLGHKPKLQVATKAMPDDDEAIRRIGTPGWEVEA